MARAASRRHPFLRDKPRGVWLPEAVGVVKGYPQTEAAFLSLQRHCRKQVTQLNAEGRAGRKGVPDGWAGRKREAQEARELATTNAQKAVKRMIEQDLIVEVPKGDEARAELALTYACQVVLDPTVQTREKLQAAKMVAEFTRAKPAQKSEVTVAKAEDFLTSLLGT